MGSRYLLFDDSCPKCRTLASQVTTAAKGRIEPLDLCSDTAMALLDRAYPGGWRWAPYLVETSGAGVRAWAGRAAKVRIAGVLGPAGVVRYCWNARRHFWSTSSAREPKVVPQALGGGLPEP
jgi:hypothetical protein